MKSLFAHRIAFIIVAAVAILFVVSLVVRAGRADEQLIVATVERGTVQQLVSVSGIASAEQSAALAFPSGGIVAAVLIEDGQAVVAGQALVRLDARALYADRQDAAAALARAVAARDELIAGPTDTARSATNEAVRKAEASLATTRTIQSKIVENARRALRSNDLEARTTDGGEEASPPTISGTYTCASEGSYTIHVYRSGAASGYSYNLSGLEFDTASAFTEQPAPLGTCGLFIQFDETDRYNNSVWRIDIPNAAGASYTNNQNALTLAETQADTAIALAEQDLAVAEASASNTNAPARTEAIARVNADITSARARVARIDAALADRTLTAPFSGTASAIDIFPGETVGVTPIVTLIADGEFELTARIPEIDIGKVSVGQHAHVVFDARSSDVLPATIEYIAIEATEIDGVAYYEARLKLTEEPTWLRSGLNADIDIVVEEVTDALRLPKRFVNISGEEGYVRIKRIDNTATTTVGIELIGNDGYVAVSGLVEGEVIIAP